jgi:hypothetical protein
MNLALSFRPGGGARDFQWDVEFGVHQSPNIPIQVKR